MKSHQMQVEGAQPQFLERLIGLINKQLYYQTQQLNGTTLLIVQVHQPSQHQEVLDLMKFMLLYMMMKERLQEMQEQF